MNDNTPPVDLGHLFRIMQVIHPDIIGVSWDGDSFDIICPTGELMSGWEFNYDSLTRGVMIGIEIVLEDQETSPFQFPNIIVKEG